MKSDHPRVGLFWFVKSGGSAHIISFSENVEESIVYAGVHTVEMGHEEYWSSLARRGSAALRSLSLPDAPVWSEYDEWPRGRVVYDIELRRFRIMADRKLHVVDRADQLKTHFRLMDYEVKIIGDPHYRSCRSI